MIPYFIKPVSGRASRLRGRRGATFLECLVVVAVVGGLLAAVGSVFVFSLKSYVGEYSAEALEMEGTRAVGELHFYMSRAVSVGLEDLNGFPEEAGSLQGSVLVLLQSDGSVVSFSFVPDSVSDGVTTGTLSITVGGVNYVYSRQVQFRGLPGTSRPFWVAADGGIGYGWELPSSSGVLKMTGVVRLGT